MDRKGEKKRSNKGRPANKDIVASCLDINFTLYDAIAPPAIASQPAGTIREINLI